MIFFRGRQAKIKDLRRLAGTIRKFAAYQTIDGSRYFLSEGKKKIFRSSFTSLFNVPCDAPFDNRNSYHQFSWIEF
jgi:hypothetical protein